MFGFVLVIVKQYQKEFAQTRRKPAANPPQLYGIVYDILDYLFVRKIIQPWFQPLVETNSIIEKTYQFGHRDREHCYDGVKGGVSKVEVANYDAKSGCPMITWSEI